MDEIIHKNGIDITQLYDINQLPFIQKEIECDIEEIRLFFMSIGKKAAELFNQKLIMTSYSDATKGALLYIQKHYQDNISLKDVAKRLSFNASYLSRVFKEDTGINFVHYLNKYRIDRALELIESTDKKTKTLANIAKEVGFNDYNQFFINFRKHVGCTPGIYWENIEKQKVKIT